LGQTQHGEPDIGDGDSAIAPTSEREPFMPLNGESPQPVRQNGSSVQVGFPNGFVAKIQSGAKMGRCEHQG